MGSSGSTDTSSQQQNISQTQLPPWVNQAAQQNYALAQNVANRPLTQYQGQQVADIGPQTQQAWNLAATSGGAGADQYNASQAAYLTAAGTPATQVNAQSLAGTNLQPYMNPYTQSVINQTMPLMQQQNALSQNQAANQANSANAFGGSRQGVQQGVAQAQGAMNIGQMAAQLNQANFGQAQTAATGDITRQLQAQQGNQQANQANINSLIQAGSGLGALGSQAPETKNQRQQILPRAVDPLAQGEQAQAQNQINAQMGQFAGAQQYPGQQLRRPAVGLGHDALRLDDHGPSSTGQTQQTTTPSLMSDVTGGLQALGSMYAGAGGPLAPLGVLNVPRPQTATSKTDITEGLAFTRRLACRLYSYRYKGDPKSYPKVVGPMAEDAMQIAPHAVRTVAAFISPPGEALHQVDMGALNMAGPPMGANDNRWAGPRSGRAACRARTGRFSTRVPGPLAPTVPAGPDRRDGRQHAATAHAAERAHAEGSGGDGRHGRADEWLTRNGLQPSLPGRSSTRLSRRADPGGHRQQSRLWLPLA